MLSDASMRSPQDTQRSPAAAARPSMSPEEAKLLFKKFLVVLGFIFVGHLAFVSAPLFPIIATASYTTQLLTYLINTCVLPLMTAFYCMGTYLQVLKTFEIWPMQNRSISFLEGDLWQDIKYAAKTFDWLALELVSEELRDKYFPQVKNFLQRLQEPGESSHAVGNFFSNLLQSISSTLTDRLKNMLRTLERNTRPVLTSTAIAAKIHELHYALAHRDTLPANHTEHEAELNKEFINYYSKHLVEGTYANKGLLESVGSALYTEYKNRRPGSTASV